MRLRPTSRPCTGASVGADHVLDLWLSCMRRIETSWVALQGAPPEETWALSWGVRLGLHAQEERIHIADCKISRIFLLEHPDDRRRWEPVAAAQADIGVRVQWLEKSRLERNHRITERLDRLKTPDVAVADKRWVFLIYLDNNRRTVGAKLSRDQAELEAARFVVEEAYQLGSME